MHFDLVFKNVLVLPSYFSVSNFSYSKEENFFSYGDMKFISLNMQYIIICIAQWWEKALENQPE